MKLQCVANYRNDARGAVYLAGEVYEVTQDEASFLKADAPGCFKDYVEPKPKAKRVAKPPRDKAVKAPGKKK